MLGCAGAPLPATRAVCSEPCACSCGVQILPDGSVWLPLLFEGIVDAALSGARKVEVTEKTVEGPDYNTKFKIFIPFLLVAQVCAALLRLAWLLCEGSVAVGCLNPPQTCVLF